MMKNKLFATILLMGCFLLSSSPVSVFASEEVSSNEEIMPRYEKISSAVADLTISGSTAESSARLVAVEKDSLSIKLTLQKRSGGSWDAINTWTTSKSSAYNCSLAKTVPISSGTYRVKAVCTCGGEVTTKYSGIEIK